MAFIFILFLQWNDVNTEGKWMYPMPRKQSIFAESLHSFDVLKYQLDVTVPMTSRSLQGINQIKCRSNTNGLNVVTLHSYTLIIDTVKVNNINATYNTANETLHINLPQPFNSGDSFNLYIRYHGSWSVTSSQTGFCYWPKNYNSNTLHSVAYTLGEPWDARSWMPCYDEPFDKADQGCIISVTAPDSFVVCANGQLVNVVNNPNNTKTWTYEETNPITTYLMHFGVSKFAKWSQWYHDPDGDSVEIRHFIWPQDSSQSLIAFQHLPDAMYLFDSLYGDYPFDRYGQDAVYPYAWGGMEHQTQTTIHRWWILNNSENGMAHELSHQWWGDMVTCVDFRDIWLNEGFATYSDANYNWYRFGYNNFITTMQNRANDYFTADAQWRHPIYNPPLSELFDWGHTYCKASWVVHMLRYLNQEQFFNALAVYRDSFEYGCASTEDLKKIFNQVYGTDLSWFFNEWVYGQGHPIYNIYWTCSPSGNNYQFIANIYQVQTNAPPIFHIPVQIKLFMGSNDTLLNIPITGSPTHIDLMVSQNVDSIKFDPNKWILCKSYTYTGIEEISKGNLDNKIILQSNPVRALIFDYTINMKAYVQFKIYDALGRMIKELEPGNKEPGCYKICINSLPAGIYFIKMNLRSGKTSVFEKYVKVVVID
uniref:Aminopeptidase N n=1 Tax=candidate division WOR-3 bacterium TaxID=2052148 RepID=A0A7C6AFY7_UNCW3